MTLRTFMYVCMYTVALLVHNVLHLYVLFCNNIITWVLFVIIWLLGCYLYTWIESANSVVMAEHTDSFTIHIHMITVSLHCCLIWSSGPQSLFTFFRRSFFTRYTLTPYPFLPFLHSEIKSLTVTLSPYDQHLLTYPTFIHFCVVQ